MAGASDKARFYLEQHVPSLQADLRAQIFTHAETTAIAAKRSDFEHILNARGSTPADYARYATYEINLDSLRKKRCKRLGVKGGAKAAGKIGYSGQRTVFFVLERATKKFPGDMGLWMQYIRFCQREKAGRKLAKVMTSVLRLKPREWGLWVLAAKWYAEEQGDMSTARSYMQRGLRFCKEQRELWVEYCRLEMGYLAKLAARRKILGLDEERAEGGMQVEEVEDENMISLPTVTAADFDTDAGKGMEQVNEETLKRLANAPAFTGAIPIVIFDAAMKQFTDDPGVAESFFDLVAAFDNVPSATRILQHILAHLQATAPNSAEAVICEAHQRLLGIDALSSDFPAALSSTLDTVKTGLASLPEKQKPALAEKAILLLIHFLEQHEAMDEDVERVLVASVNRYLRMASSKARSKAVKAMVETGGPDGRLGGAQMVQLWRDCRSQG